MPDPNTFSGELTIYGDDKSVETIESTGSTSGRGTGVVDLAQSIRAGRPERASGEQAYHVLDVLLSILDSAERQEPVSVESTTVLSPPLPEAWDPRDRTLG